MVTGIVTPRLLTVTVAAVAALTTAVCVPAGTATAAPAHVWQRVTGAGGASIDEVGFARRSDGTLDVVWQIGTDASSGSLYDTTISPAGRLGTTNTIASNWSAISNPAVTAGPGGSLDAFFGGIRSTAPTETNTDLNLATSTSGGSSWSLTTGDIAHLGDGDDAYASTISAATDPLTATPYETWNGTSGVWVHAGISPSSPNNNFLPSAWGCCGYSSNIAFNSAGAGMVDWYSNATGRLGVWAQPVTTDGTPGGSPQQLPGTGNMSVGESQRTPLAAGPGGAFYIAYPTGYPSFTKVVLWRVGSSTTRTIATLSGTGGTAASIAADSNGRLWVLWTDGSGPTVYARRSNLSGTVFGATVDAGAPAHTESIYSLDGNASPTALDAFAVDSPTGSNGSATWWTHIYPGLTLTSSRTSLTSGQATRVSFTVTDAGDPVAGATVKVGRRALSTNRHGTASLTLTATRSVAVSAARSSYTGASLRLRVVSSHRH